MPLKVMVVDDSAFMRKVISDMLLSSPGIEVVATAKNGVEALEKMVKYKPQVITLDVEMPQMDGLTALKQIMVNSPTPVIMLSSLTQQGSRETLEALSLGALDFVPKPSGAISLDLEKVKSDLISKVKAAGKAQPGPKKLKAPLPTRALPAKEVKPASQVLAKKIVAIGSSTGGPKALEHLLLGFPANLPAGVLVTQHMPEGFTRSLAERLDRICPLKVKEAEKGDEIREGQVIIAPGGYHLKLDKNKKVYLSQEAPVQHVRPSADVMMMSLVECYGTNIVGVILTGMGKDGTTGMTAIKKAGGKTIVQDSSTSVIFSMPSSVIKAGCADMVSPLPNISPKIVDLLK